MAGLCGAATTPKGEFTASQAAIARIFLLKALVLLGFLIFFIFAVVSTLKAVSGSAPSSCRA
jgi:hypothetical protein